MMTPNNEPMNRINKTILCGLLLCLLGAAGKGYGQTSTVLKSSSRVSEEDVNELNAGWIVNVTQISHGQGTKAAHNSNFYSAQSQINGDFIDPETNEIYVNEADPDAFDYWSYNYDESDVINFNQDAPGSSGFFDANNGHEDKPIPNIPGWGDSNDGIAAEFLTVIYLTKGEYAFGINSDDGFLVHCGSQVVGQNISAGYNETIFNVSVAVGGFYPLRIIWWEGSGGANIEVFHIDSSGNKHLIGDTKDPLALKCYYPKTSIRLGDTTKVRITENITLDNLLYAEGFVLSKVGSRDLSSYLAVGQIRDQQKPSATDGVFRYETRGHRNDGGEFQGIRKVKIKTGEIVWEKYLGSTYAQPIISKHGTIIYATDADIYAFDINSGDQVWLNKLKAADGIFANMAHGGKYLYVSHRGRGLVAIDPLTGKTDWSFPPDDHESPDYIDYGRIVSPILVDFDETVYGASYRYIYAIDGLTGTVKWKIKTEAESNSRKWKEFGSQHYSSPLLTDSGVVYFSFPVFDEYGESEWEKLQFAGLFSGIYAIDTKTGNIIWNNRDYGSVWTEPVLDENNNIISYDSEGLSVLLKGGLALADSPWPMTGQNPESTSMVPAGNLELVEFDRPQSDIVEKGLPIKFSVKSKGEWPRTYQWEFNGEPIEGATQPSLTIENATLKDAGRYRVTITNKHGSVTSNEAVLKVVNPGTPLTFTDGKELIGSAVKGDKAEIILSTKFEGGSIYFTTDGGEPSFESTLYREPFTITETSVIRALAYSVDFSDYAESDPVVVNIMHNYVLNAEVSGQGSVIKEPSLGKHIQDSVVKVRAVSDEGWRFLHWEGALTGAFEKGTLVMDGDKSITAVFEPIPRYGVGVRVLGEGEITGNKGKRYYVGETAQLSLSVKDGWELMHWNVESSVGYLVSLLGGKGFDFQKHLSAYHIRYNDMRYDAVAKSIELDGDLSDWAGLEFKSQIPFEKGGGVGVV